MDRVLKIYCLVGWRLWQPSLKSKQAQIFCGACFHLNTNVIPFLQLKHVFVFLFVQHGTYFRSSVGLYHSFTWHYWQNTFYKIFSIAENDRSFSTEQISQACRKNVVDKKTANSICSSVSSKITPIVSANKLLISYARGHD